REIRYYDTEQHPTLSKDGFHKEVTFARDGRGNPLRWAYFGTAGEKATDGDGAHEYRETWDARGFAESFARFDSEGRPTIGPRGYHRIAWQYDASGNKEWEPYFDREGRPTRDSNGWYRLKLTYDDRGSITEWANSSADVL